jgi:hypothetical protein
MLSLLKNRGSLSQPNHVGIVGGGDIELKLVVVLNGGPGAGILPLLNLSMPIGKG